jgi:hypothetical protein
MPLSPKPKLKNDVIKKRTTGALFGYCVNILNESI